MRTEPKQDWRVYSLDLCLVAYQKRTRLLSSFSYAIRCSSSLWQQTEGATMEGGWGSDEGGHMLTRSPTHTLHLCLTSALHQFFPGTLVASSAHETHTPRPNTTYQVTIAQHSTWLLGQKCIQLFKASCQSVQSRRGLPHYSRKQLLRLMPHSWLSPCIKCPL